MKRVITITMDIDESTHEAKITTRITEDGKVKKTWTPPQGISTAKVLIQTADMLMTDLHNFMIQEMDKMKEDEK